MESDISSPPLGKGLAGDSTEGRLIDIEPTSESRSALILQLVMETDLSIGQAKKERTEVRVFLKDAKKCILYIGGHLALVADSPHHRNT